MRTNALLPILLFVGASATPSEVNAQTSSNPNTAAQSSAAAPNSTAADDGPDWLFPVSELDESLPKWLHIGGQYRNRLEGPTGIGYAATRDFYLLDRLRVKSLTYKGGFLNEPGIRVLNGFSTLKAGWDRY